MVVVPRSSTFLAAAELRAKALTLRAALGLPERVQRTLAGRRVTLDGQTLATETQLLLRLERALREPEIATLPVPDGRRALLLQTVIAGGDQPIGAVRDLPVGDLRARLYVPTGVTARSPLLVYFHGGGWVYGDLDSHDPVCRFLAERSGVRVLSVDYRLAPEHPFPAALRGRADGVPLGRRARVLARRRPHPARRRWRLRRRHPGSHHGDRRGAGGSSAARSSC